MEENKNNAVEKVENIINGKVQLSSESVEREKQKEQERTQKAMLEHRDKVEKERAKKQKAQVKQAQKQAEKERKEMLKQKSEQERQNLKRLEKKAKAERREAKRQERASIIREKMQYKSQKEKHRHERKKDRRGYGGWLAAVIALGVSTIALASALTVTFLMPQEADLAMESVYSKSFYDTVEQVDNIDLNLSKALATRDTGAIQMYLVDLAINSELAENDLQQLPLQDESKYYTTKLVNQIGDYAKYLNKKLINGENLSSDDRQVLLRLYNANLSLKESLQNMMHEPLSTPQRPARGSRSHPIRCCGDPADHPRAGQQIRNGKADDGRGQVHQAG